ncbi:keratin-associated protein 5-3-like isoform X2 [Macrobrachium rosenbergii]|uniref:keratin-associated protein 5-3-like isoform X2 n=1 Tax=Macrobrachium rosenbergii TaxID=79674 RepID=UPI0034D58D63
MGISSIRLVFATLLASASVCQGGGPGCSTNAQCGNYGGTCVPSGACSGFSVDACGSAVCTCCVPDNGNCVRLPDCEGIGGMCIHLTESSNCTGVLDSGSCLGTSCTCCMEGCPTTYKCIAAGGYCFRNDGPHVCGGGVLDLCGNTLCSCCVNPPQCPCDGDDDSDGESDSEGDDDGHGHGKGNTPGTPKPTPKHNG